MAEGSLSSRRQPASLLAYLMTLRFVPTLVIALIATSTSAVMAAASLFVCSEYEFDESAPPPPPIDGQRYMISQQLALALSRSADQYGFLHRVNFTAAR